MQSIFQTTVPGLRSRLYRPPETDDELKYKLKELPLLPLFRETVIEKMLKNDSRRHTKKVASLPGLKLH
jgi:hypothetical protein